MAGSERHAALRLSLHADAADFRNLYPHTYCENNCMLIRLRTEQMRTVSCDNQFLNQVFCELGILSDSFNLGSRPKCILNIRFMQL